MKKLIPILAILLVSNVGHSDVVDTQKNDTQTSKEIVAPVSKEQVPLKTDQPSMSMTAPGNPAMSDSSMKKEGTIYANNQGETTSDVKITQAIRKEVMADKTLSNYAKNVQIITKDGVVVLKGFVVNQDEAAKIGSIASKIPGVKSVTNSLKVNIK